MQKGSFQVILYEMIRFLSGKLKKHMKLAKIVKISEIFNQLVFPLNFNRFCHPMTVILLLPVTVNKLFEKLHIVNNYIDVCLLWTVKIYLQLFLFTLAIFFDDW